jgi:5-methylcytosine-specific restriction protein A
MLAPTPCLDCGETAVKYGRCQVHQRPPWIGSTRQQRLPNDWNTRRLLVFKRDGDICYVCKGKGADAIDHVVQGDDHSLENLKPIHEKQPPHCHRYKSSQEGTDTQRAMRIKRRH